MAKVVVDGTVLKCKYGLAPSKLTVISQQGVSTGGNKVGTVADSTAASVGCFGMCQSPNNPMVAASPVKKAPCTYTAVGKWAPGASCSTINGKKSLLCSDKLSCAYAPDGISLEAPVNSQVESE